MAVWGALTVVTVFVTVVASVGAIAVIAVAISVILSIAVPVTITVITSIIFSIRVITSITAVFVVTIIGLLSFLRNLPVWINFQLLRMKQFSIVLVKRVLPNTFFSFVVEIVRNTIFCLTLFPVVLREINAKEGGR